MTCTWWQWWLKFSTSLLQNHFLGRVSKEVTSGQFVGQAMDMAFQITITRICNILQSKTWCVNCLSVAPCELPMITNGQYLSGYRAGLTIANGSSVTFQCDSDYSKSTGQPIECILGELRPRVPACRHHTLPIITHSSKCLTIKLSHNTPCRRLGGEVV